MSSDELADPRAEERVGCVLADKWTLVGLLGLGGMGAVYEARHRNGARAAVKLLHPELARNTEVRERFRREGYAANKVEHRSTVKVLDDDIVRDGPDEGAAYIVMELLEGESLDARSEREPRLSEWEILEILDTVLDVLEAAHDKGVVHRDLKPDNLFLAKDPDSKLVRVKVLDFGLARISEAARVTSHGLALGTPAFMSPEQAAGLPDIDGRADLFALGATAFYVFTGQHIHESSTVLQQIVKMAKDQAAPLKSLAPDASDDFCAIVDKALQVDRDDRYPSAAAMHADVRAALERRAAANQARTLVVSGTSPAATPFSGPTEAESKKRGGFPLVSFMLLALVGLGWMFWPRIRERVADLRMGYQAGGETDADAGSSEAAVEPDAEAPLEEIDAGLLVVDLDAGEDAGEGDELDIDADAGAIDDDGGVDDEDEDDEEEEDEDAGAASDGGSASPAPHPTARPKVKRVHRPTKKHSTKKRKKRRHR